MKSLRKTSGPHVDFDAFQSDHAVLRFRIRYRPDEIVAVFSLELKHGSNGEGFVCRPARGPSLSVVLVGPNEGRLFVRLQEVAGRRRIKFEEAAQASVNRGLCAVDSATRVD